MARRAFISFDYDNDNDNDARLKDLLVGQAKNSDTPFVIADWSIKEPSADWKDKARRQIRASGLVIVLCGKNMSTANSQPELCSGPSRRAFWELALRLLWLSGLPQTERKSAVDAMLTLSLANLPSTSSTPSALLRGPYLPGGGDRFARPAKTPASEPTRRHATTVLPRERFVELIRNYFVRFQEIFNVRIWKILVSRYVVASKSHLPKRFVETLEYVPRPPTDNVNPISCRFGRRLPLRSIRPNGYALSNDGYPSDDGVDILTQLRQINVNTRPMSNAHFRLSARADCKNKTDKRGDCRQDCSASGRHSLIKSHRKLLRR